MNATCSRHYSRVVHQDIYPLVSQLLNHSINAFGRRHVAAYGACGPPLRAQRVSHLHGVLVVKIGAYDFRPGCRECLREPRSQSIASTSNQGDFPSEIAQTTPAHCGTSILVIASDQFSAFCIEYAKSGAKPDQHPRCFLIPRRPGSTPSCHSISPDRCSTTAR
jgi:hypothetical protein